MKPSREATKNEVVNVTKSVNPAIASTARFLRKRATQMITIICQRTLRLGLVCLALMANEGLGAPITFRFEGTVASVQASDPQSWPEVGAPFRGTYTFDSNATDSSADEFSGVYTAPAPSGVQVEVGRFKLEGGGSYVTTHDVFAQSPPYDLYEAGNWLSSMEFTARPEPGAVFDLDRNHFQLRIRGDSQLLDGLSLPLSPPSLASATEATLTLSLDSRRNLGPLPLVRITGTLESLTLVRAKSSLSDLTNNGYVDFEDLAVMLSNWNEDVVVSLGNLVDPTNTPINFDDLAVLLSHWTGTDPAGSPEAALGAEAVPEPSAFVLAALGLLGLCGFRRRRRRRIAY